MIVDTPGFQNPELGGSARGASFEELCHNYAQDRLQRLFHERTFVQELERYKEVALDLASACPLRPPSLTLWPWPPQRGYLWIREGTTFPAGCSFLAFTLSSCLSTCAVCTRCLPCPEYSYFVESLLSQKLKIYSGSLGALPCPHLRCHLSPVIATVQFPLVHVRPAFPVTRSVKMVID